MGASRRAVTLIELLAVVVILGSVMGIAVGVAGPMAGASSERAAAASLTALLERARATGIARGACSIVNDPTSGGVTLRSPGVEGGEPSASDGGIAPSWAIAIYESAHWREPAIVELPFNHEGRCPDVFIELRGPRDVVVRYELLGAAGQLTRQEVGQ